MSKRNIRVEFFGGEIEDVLREIDSYMDFMDSYMIVDDSFEKINPLKPITDHDTCYRLLMFKRATDEQIELLADGIDLFYIAIMDTDTNEVLYEY